jgi:hypothetical protein
MARPIEPTPTLYGKDAIAVLKRMKEPPTKKEIEYAKKIRNQRFVKF